MGIKTVVLLIYYTLKAGRPAVLRIAVGLPLMVLALALMASPQAALTVLVIEAGLFALTVMLAGRLMERFFNATLEPARDYGQGVDRPAVEYLKEQLKHMGFAPVGLYLMDQSVLEVLTREDWKVYATIHCGAPGIKPHLEFTSLYEGQRVYQVSDMNIKSEWFYPDCIVNDNFPGQEPGELLNTFLLNRPDRGLLETPPEKFPEFYEMERRLTREHLTNQGRKK